MLSIDGVHIENDLGLHLLADSDETALPQVRQDTVTVPGKHGAYAFDAYMEPRQFFERIMIPTQATLNDVQAIVRKVSTLLLDQYGKPKTVKLVFDYEPDKYYMAKFSGFISINRIAKAGIFPIPFKAYDPWAHSIVYSDEITWESTEITWESNYTFEHTGTDSQTTITSPTTLEAYVGGYAVKPIIEISGSADNLTVTNNGQSFSLPAFTDTTWVIDCEKYTVTKNGQNAFNEVSLREFWLNEGKNTLQITGSNINIYMRVKFHDKWM